VGGQAGTHKCLGRTPGSVKRSLALPYIWATSVTLVGIDDIFIPLGKRKEIFNSVLARLHMPNPC
jgi:hypothetical protein